MIHSDRRDRQPHQGVELAEYGFDGRVVTDYQDVRMAVAQQRAQLVGGHHGVLATGIRRPMDRPAQQRRGAHQTHCMRGHKFSCVLDRTIGVGVRWPRVVQGRKTCAPLASGEVLSIVDRPANGADNARMVRWRRAFASLLVVFGVLTSTWAICAEGSTARAAQQMACCKAGHDQCPMKDSASDCCQRSGPLIQSQGTVVKAVSFAASVPVPLAWVTFAAVASAAQLPRRVSYDLSPPGLLFAPPAYIAFSALLI
jgi:hypothetical protein